MSKDTRILDVAMAQVALLIANADLIEELGGEHLYERMTSDIDQVPGIYWYLLPSAVDENTERAVVRWEAWGRGTKQAFRIERLIRATLHFELPVLMGGIVTWSTYRQSYDTSDAEEQHDDTARRIIEIEIQPVRVDRT